MKNESPLVAAAATVITPGTAGYDEARLVWNGMIDRRPAAIVQCTNVDDVVAAIRHARSENLAIAVRGGGHNVAGYATVDEGLVIDLGAMKRVEVDPENRIVSVGGGALWADVDRAAQKHGLAVPGGVVSETGVAGLTLAGGYGWIRGRHGLSCDNLIGAEVVLADGSIVQASEDENADLLWGLRGGGGNFGVVTRLVFRAHPIGPEIFFNFVFHDGRGDGMRNAARWFRDWCRDLPDEIAPLAVIGQVPPGHELFPDELYGTPFFLLAAMYAGDSAEGERLLAPTREFATPLADFSDHMPYVKAQTIFDEDFPAHELRYYWKSANLPALGDDLIDVIVDHALRQPSPLSTTDIWHVGGAVRRTSEDDMAFTGRDIGFLFNAEANWRDPADDVANMSWVTETHAAIRDYADGRAYFNFGGFADEARSAVENTFGTKYDRLRKLKRKYDPENLFRLNQNIEPG
jgi:FAD/FMN-containing dehydrogenase